MSQPADEDAPPARVRRRFGLRTTATRRTLLMTALGGLLIAGTATVMPTVGGWPQSVFAHLGMTPTADTAGKPTPALNINPGRANEAFDHTQAGDCLTWPDNSPESVKIVDCAAEHRFEVAGAVDMRLFPGTEYGPDAPPPSAERIREITQEQCAAAVRRYLGPKFDPHSKYAASMLWSGDRAWRQHGERRMLCGLQLQGADGQLLFEGRVADIDQSKVWPPGTCLGIDTETGQPSDIPVDCAAPHTKEVTGTVNLAERFPGELPPEHDQDEFIKEACTRLTDEYLAPVQLRNTTLTLTYATISLPSWAAGSHQVACSIGATLGNGGWAALVNSARGDLLINGQPPIPPPQIPVERLDQLPSGSPGR